jgi:RNA polymerase sigma factor (sigma-70 family)
MEKQFYDEAYLLQKMKSGSKEAFELVYENYIHFIYKIAYSVLKDQKEAEDLCHDIFIEMMEKIYEYDQSRGSLKAWLAVKTKSRSIDKLRKKKAILVDEYEEFVTKHRGSHSNTEDNVISNIQKNVLKDALDDLPVEQRQVLEKAYFEGRTQRELANQLKKPLGTIKSLVRYGLNNLRKQKVVINWGKTSGGGDE